MTAVVIFEGPRGCGKTTIIRTLLNGGYFDPVLDFKAVRGVDPTLDMLSTLCYFANMQETSPGLVILIDRFHLTELVMRSAEDATTWKRQLKRADAVHATLVRLLQNPLLIMLTVSEHERLARLEHRSDGRGDEPEEVRDVWRRVYNFYEGYPCTIKVDTDPGMGIVIPHVVNMIRDIQGGRNAHSLAYLGAGSH